MIVICGKEGRSYWFLFQKMDETYSVPNIPRWTREDAIKQVNDNRDFKITEKVCLADLWKTCVSFTLVSLEEALFDKWTWGRMACLGDCIHKVVQNLPLNLLQPADNYYLDDTQRRSGWQPRNRERRSSSKQPQNDDQ